MGSAVRSCEVAHDIFFSLSVCDILVLSYMQSRRTSYTNVVLTCAVCCVVVLSGAPRSYAVTSSIADSPIESATPSGVAPTTSQSTVPAIASSSMFIFLHDLRLGTVSEDVRQLQKFLNTHGALVSTRGPGSPGNETTRFGGATKRALSLYQARNHIAPAVGILGPLTRTHINTTLAPLLCQTDLSSFDAVTRQYYRATFCPKYVSQTVVKPVKYVNRPNTISIQHISLPQPVPGATPATSIVSTSEYSGSVVWENNPTVFTSDTTYTAVITLFTHKNYSLAKIPANYFVVDGALSTTNTKGSEVVRAVFPATGTVTLTISDPVLTLSKSYDGTTDATVTAGTLTGVVPGEDVSVTATATYDTPLVGTNKTITVVYTLSGVDAGHYVMPAEYVVQTGEIVVADALATLSFTPTASKIPMTFAREGVTDPVGTTVAIVNPTEGAQVYYTTDGTDPTTSSTLYTQPLLVNSDTTVKSIATKYGYQDSPVSTSTYTINKSTTTAFSFPHGTRQVGDKFYFATRTIPATITVFNDPNDLTNSQTVTLTGHSNIDELVYDSVHDKLYASAYDGAIYSAPHKTTILQIDPHNIANWSVVYNEGIVLYNDGPFPIVTDGEYVYGATYAGLSTNMSKFFKIRISDWTLVASTTWTNRKYAHSAYIITYPDRKEMYVTSVYANLQGLASPFAKVNLTNMTFTQVNLGTADARTSITDDMACQYVDTAGSVCFVGSDGDPTRPLGYKVDTALMTVSEFEIGGNDSSGMFIIDNTLYSLDGSGKIIRYSNLDITAPQLFSTPSISPNELFYSSDGKIFVSDWKSPSQLIEFRLSS